MSIPSLYVMSTNVSFGVPVNSHKWHLIACFIIQIRHKPLHFAPPPGTFTSEMDSSSSCRPSSKKSLLCEALPGPLRLTRHFRPWAPAVLWLALQGIKTTIHLSFLLDHNCLRVAASYSVPTSHTLPDQAPDCSFWMHRTPIGGRMPIPPSPFRNSPHVLQTLFEFSSSERPVDHRAFNGH